MVVLKQTLISTMKFPTIPMQAMKIIRDTKNLDLPTHRVRPVVELTTPQRNVTLEETQ